MLRSFLQLIALALFLVVFLTIALLLAAYTGHLGVAAHDWVDWFVQEGLKNRSLIEKVFALIGAVSTLTISALGVYKTWHFAEINLPQRLEELADRWRLAAIRCRPAVIPDLALVESISLTAPHERGFWTKLVSIIYDPDQTALLERTRKVDRSEQELCALEMSRSRCVAEIQTGYLELGDLLKRCDPLRGEGALNLFKKPLERDPLDVDALELSARQAYAIGMRGRACDYLVRLIDATRASAGVRHARALRFHAEILRSGSQADRTRARAELEEAVSALSAADGAAVNARNSELGLVLTELAEVHLSAGRFRLARSAFAEARQRLGPTKRLQSIWARLPSAKVKSSDTPKPGDGAA